MTKIKNFRIALRPRELSRWLKKERGLETTPDLEVAVDLVIKEMKSLIVPAAIYTTLTQQIAEKTTTLSFPKKAIAVSIVAISISPALDAERQKNESGEQRASLLAAAHQEALAQSMQFALRLVQDQAKEEDCEVSAAFSAEDPALAASLATLLGVQRIGIDLESSNSQLPSYVRVAWSFWTPIGKGSSRRPDRSPSEKVAA